MTQKQNMILWMGIALISLNLVSYWPTIKKVIFGSPTKTTSTSVTVPQNGTVLSASQTPAKAST